MNFMRANILSFLTLIVMITISVALNGGLPEQIPSNYDINGIARGEIDKSYALVVIPLSYLLLILVTTFLIKISPEKFSMPNSHRAMNIILFGAGLLLLFTHLGLLNSVESLDVFFRYFSIGLALFLVVVGNVWGKTERNFFIGIRLPWTLASARNWRATHRFAGKLMVVSGLLILLFSFIWQNLFVLILFSAAPIFIPIIYSYLYYARNERNEQV